MQQNIHSVEPFEWSEMGCDASKATFREDDFTGLGSNLLADSPKLTWSHFYNPKGQRELT